MKEAFIDLSRPVDDPLREGVRDADAATTGRIAASTSAMDAQAATQAAIAAKLATDRAAATAAIKTKAQTDPAFAALVTVLGL